MRILKNEGGKISEDNTMGKYEIEDSKIFYGGREVHVAKIIRNGKIYIFDKANNKQIDFGGGMGEQLVKNDKKAIKQKNHGKEGFVWEGNE